MIFFMQNHNYPHPTSVIKKKPGKLPIKIADFLTKIAGKAGSLKSFNVGQMTYSAGKMPTLNSHAVYQTPHVGTTKFSNSHVQQRKLIA